MHKFTTLRLAAAVSCVLYAGISAAQAPSPWLVRGAPGTWELGIEGMAWWLRDTPAPVPLVTNGVVGLPNVQTYLGGQDLNVGASGGLKLTAAYALSATTAIEGNVFFLPYRSTSKNAFSSGQQGSVDLVVPFFNPNTAQEDGDALSYAPIWSGSGQEEYEVGMAGGEINGAWALSTAAPWTVDVLGGFRYLRLRETYTFTTSSPYIPPYTPAGTWETSDRFQTTNNFYGLQAGLRGRYDNGAFFGIGSLKLALGAMSQEADIGGAFVTDEFSAAGATQTFSGGYFALPSNIGNYSRTVFSVLPEIKLTMGYRFNQATSVYLGYSFLYATNIVRPGNQIDRTVNPTQGVVYTEDPNTVVQGAARPSFSYRDSDFWAQGISIGLSYRF